MNEFNFDTEENFINNPSGTKTLEQLFDVDIKKNVGDESLRYVPPKAAETSSSETTLTGTTATATGVQIEQVPWQTQLAKLVMGFKNGVTLGRVAVAILSNINNTYRILVYRTKTNVLATLTITEATNTTQIHRQNCYWQFYDDTGAYWSLLFERVSDETEFIQKLEECDIQMQLEIDVNSENRKFIEETEKRKIEALKRVESKMIKAKEDESSSEEQQQKSSKNVSTQRTKLINRLPKMGAQQLPQLVNKESISTTTELSDSEAETIDRSSSLTVINEPRSIAENNKVCTQFMLPLAPTGVTATSGAMLGQIESQMMQMMLVENRTQNTELRINLDKLETKIEKVLDKIGMLEGNTEHDDEVLRLEEKVLELKKENRKLRRERKNSGGRSEEDNEKILRLYGGELTNLGINIETLDGKSSMETPFGDLIDKSLALQNDLEEKENELKSALAKGKEAKEKYDKEVQSHNETRKKLEEALTSVESLEVELEKKTNIETFLNERLMELSSQHAAQLHAVKLEMTETVKDIMNGIYHDLAENIVGMDKLVPEKILALIGKTIRQDTLYAVAKISK